MPKVRKADPSKLSHIPDTVRNESSLSLDQVHAILAKDGVEISYGDLAMVTERRSLDDARRAVHSIPAAERPRLMASVDQALQRNLQAVSDGVATKAQMDAFHNDLLLWTVLTEGKTN